MFIALPNTFGDAVTNMAIDAALLANMPVGFAAFRHYGWREPAVTFGYTQEHHKVVSELESGNAPIELAQTSATLTRRMTGGGIVDHRNDWTYALILNSFVSAASTPAYDLYAQSITQSACRSKRSASTVASHPVPTNAKRPPMPVTFQLAALSPLQPMT